MLASKRVESPILTEVVDESRRKTKAVLGRRRKKSCIPRPTTPSVCEECFARGVQCRNQEVSLGTKPRPEDGKHTLQQRVAELETALLSVSRRLEATPGTTESGEDALKALQQPHSQFIPPESVASSASNLGAPLKHAPVLSLFDNAILSSRPDVDTMQDPKCTRPLWLETKNNPNPRLDTVRRALLSLFPSQEKQEAILNASYTWWVTWHDMFPLIFGLESFSHVVQFIADLKDSGDVQKIAKALLCLFTILQEGPVGVITSHDMVNAANDMRQALSIIDDIILTDDGLAGTMDGVECLMLRARYENNKGRVRRAWLLFRRGISCAQLLGLHKRQAGYGNTKNQSLRRESLWKVLYSSDRLLSLLLGLPYGPSEIHSDVGRDSELSAKGIKVQNTEEHYLFRLATIVGHIIDRNQQMPSNNMLPLTFKIESEMMELAASMPDNWWKSGLDHDAVASHMNSLFIPQFWHHQARTLLHLPFMLKATTDRVFEYNKTATLESSREMIARYLAVRPARWFSYLICKLIDFQVFTAAMILVLNLLDHYRKSEAIDHREAEQDQDLITLTTDMLRRTSLETEGGVATQAARALDIFGNVKELALPVGMSVDECTAKVAIPYFGTVVIGPGTSLRDQAEARKFEATAQPQQLPTPGDQSLDGSIQESVPFSNPSTAPMVSLGLNYNEDTQGMEVNGNIFTDINFDLDQDWNWFWDNIDIPSVDLQGMVP